MKLEVLIGSSGRPCIFFTDQVNPRNKTIACYTHAAQHGEAARGYMRRCKKPEHADEIRACWALLREWANLPG